MIACVLNKEQNNAQVTTFVNSIVFDLWTSKEDHDRRKESLELIAWVITSWNIVNSSLRKHLFYELMQKDTI